MKINTALTTCLVAASVLISDGCKKSDQTVKAGQVTAPDCDPVQLYSTTSDSTYIVMLRSADSQSGSVQDLGKIHICGQYHFKPLCDSGKPAGRHTEQHTFRIYCPSDRRPRPWR